MRPALCDEAIRLARLLAGLATNGQERALLLARSGQRRQTDGTVTPGT